MTVNQNDCVKQNNICLKPVSGNQIVASVKIKIATVESPRHPLPLLPKPATRLLPTKKKTRVGNSSWSPPQSLLEISGEDRCVTTLITAAKDTEGTQARNKNPVEAVIVKTNSYKLAEKVTPTHPSPHHFLNGLSLKV